MNKVLITGSSGHIGTIITPRIQQKNHLILIDKYNTINSIDILTDDLTKYFKDATSVIHLAANPDPFIDSKEAERNIVIAQRVLDACDSANKLVRIINASSINVYPYLDIYRSGNTIERITPLFPNTRFGGGHYGNAKIRTEKLFNSYSLKRGISLLNLRLGCVPKIDIVPEDGIEKEIYLSHSDLQTTFEKALEYKGIGSFVCVSKKDGLVSESVRFPIN